MAKLDKEQRKARKDARFRERVEQRRANGSDVVAYALINSRAYKFLTDSEKEELRVRRAARKARRDARVPGLQRRGDCTTRWSAAGRTSVQDTRQRRCRSRMTAVGTPLRDVCGRGATARPPTCGGIQGRTRPMTRIRE